MQKLINELMEFRKAESGHTAIYAEKVDIHLLVDYVSDNYTEIAEENKIDFSFKSKEVSSFYYRPEFAGENYIQLII